MRLNPCDFSHYLLIVLNLQEGDEKNWFRETRKQHKQHKPAENTSVWTVSGGLEDQPRISQNQPRISLTSARTSPESLRASFLTVSTCWIHPDITKAQISPSVQSSWPPAPHMHYAGVRARGLVQRLVPAAPFIPAGPHPPPSETQKQMLMRHLTFNSITPPLYPPLRCGITRTCTCTAQARIQIIR